MRKLRTPRSTEQRHDLGRALRHGVEQRVAAADVGRERMLHADAVAELDVVRVAGPAAVGLVRARRKDRAEDAVLHVKHRHVLVDDDFEPLRRHGGDQIEQLLAIQVVRRRDAARSRRSSKYCGRQLVGRVERKIGDDGNAAARQKNPARARLRTRMPSALCFASA